MLQITAKIKLYVSKEQENSLYSTIQAYKKACNFVSEIIFNTKILDQKRLHELAYYDLRNNFNLKSQMSQSVMKTVISKYKTNKTHTLIKFQKPEYDLVWNRDYSMLATLFSVNTLDGRIKVPFEKKGMSKYFDDSWKFGNAKLLYKHNKWFLHIPMTKGFNELNKTKVHNIVGIDLGINFLATSYDSKGKTMFFSGKSIKHKREKYKTLRKQLQQRRTSSARRKLKTIGQRENRWIKDINHTVTKALINQYDKNTLFVLEDLTGIRSATEKVKQKNRYVYVSWAFYKFRQMLEYKAKLNLSKVITVDPKYTSQSCPKCKHTEKSNRNKKTHVFCCKTCNYTSNDDRIGAMNLHLKGIEYIIGVAQ